MPRNQRSLRECIRRALCDAVSRERPPGAYRVRVHHGRLLPGVEPRRMNQLAEALEDEESVRRTLV